MSNQRDRNMEDINEEDIDEDDILTSNLSPEELKELQKEMDIIAPDERVPVGQRQKSQTEKVPTGSFDHRGLVDYLYWEKESKRMLEEERVPVTLLPNKKTMEEDAEKKENAEHMEIVYEVQEEDIEVEATDGVEGEEMIVEEEVEDRKNINYERVIEIHEHPVNKHLNESLDDNSTNTVYTTSPLQPPPEFTNKKEEKETESREQKKSTSQISEKVEMNTTETPEGTEMTPEEKRACFVPEKEVRVINKLSIPSLALGGGLGGLGGAKKTSRPSGNETNLDTTLDKICHNNPTITDVNLNNIENIPKEMLVEYVNALKKNKHVKTFSIANTGADENIAFTLANMLRENRSITTLNIESNFITGKGIIAIIRCLTKLRFHNQRHMLGHHAEMEVSRLLKANNTLLKMGYHFEQAGPRMVVTNLLTRNLDRQRQQRNEEQSKQQKQEQKEVFEMYDAMLGYIPPEIAALMPQLPKGPQGPMEPKPEPFSRVKQSNTSPQYQHKQLYHTPQRNPIPQQPPSMDSSGNPLRDIQLKRTPKKRDPFLDLDPRDDRRAERLNVQLRNTTGKQRGTGVDEMVELKATLKDVMKTLKPVPRRRQPPKVDVTPRDELLNEIKKSNVAYLKAAPSTRGSKATPQQDNDPKHTSKSTQE
ncbi:leiomodin-3-like [Salvelinus namaycush]|uniref:Leiomodin-3 n=1 Tax=Salvelinus namaycush TaxID=8040 RepID=A0A8U1EVB3_SALNM|nr:leiomodin-3-like [Salvelinus namaycush]